MRTGARWKCVKAPLDAGGPCGHLPPPLRVAWFCPQHHRQWLSTAMRVLPTKVVLSHIACNARPVFGSDTKKMAETDLGFEATHQKKKRRIPRKGR